MKSVSAHAHFDSDDVVTRQFGVGKNVNYSRWKLHEYFENGDLELCNLKDDIGEKINLADSKPDRVKELHDMLKTWHRAVGAPVPTDLNPEYEP